jgi:hypothetical protein
MTSVAGRSCRTSPTSGPRPRWAGAVLGCLALMLVVPAILPAQAAATGEEPPTPAQMLTTRIEVSFEPSRMARMPHYLVARLVAEDGSAVTGQEVRLRRTADAFGGRRVTLGRGMTDNAGVARVAVEPRERVYHVTASFAGTDTLVASETVVDVAFPADVVSIPERAAGGRLVDPRLRPLADVMPFVIGIGFVLVWAILLVLTVVTLVRIRSASRDVFRAPSTTAERWPGEPPGERSETSSRREERGRYEIGT